MLVISSQKGKGMLFPKVEIELIYRSMFHYKLADFFKLLCNELVNVINYREVGKLMNLLLRLLQEKPLRKLVLRELFRFISFYNSIMF